MMMIQALADELTATNAIYGDDTFTLIPGSGNSCILRLPFIHVSLRLTFAEDYPESKPHILGPESAGADLRKGTAHEVMIIAQHVLESVFVPGEPCVYDLLEGLKERFDDEELPHGDETTSKELGGGSNDQDEEHDDSSCSLMASMHAAPQWTLSDVVTEKKSVFLARAASVTTPSEARRYVQHLVTTDKKAAKATHNITAWRMKSTAEGKEAEVVFQDCDDDGEDAAGGRLLHLLQVMDVWNVVVVISRWYGGVHLGPDRFRLINNVARDALVKSGMEKVKK